MVMNSTGAQPPNALGYGMFVNIAYEVYDASPDNLNPSVKDYPSLPDNYEVILNVQMTDFFLGQKVPKYYGFFAWNATRSELVLAIRGTQTWREWWDDFDDALVPFPYMTGAGNVANGFLKLYETLAVTVPDSDAPARLLKDEVNVLGNTNYTVIANGHSLGSALVTLYAAHIASQGQISPTVYTLASPRVGDKGFVDAYNKIVKTNYRIYNWPDLVPRFPKDPFDYYYHVKGGYEVDSLEHPLTVKMTVDCFHSIYTYLYLLGAPSSILGGLSGCGY